MCLNLKRKAVKDEVIKLSPVRKLLRRIKSPLSSAVQPAQHLRSAGGVTAKLEWHRDGAKPSPQRTGRRMHKVQGFTPCLGHKMRIHKGIDNSQTAWVPKGSDGTPDCHLLMRSGLCHERIGVEFALLNVCFDKQMDLNEVATHHDGSREFASQFRRISTANERGSQLQVLLSFKTKLPLLETLYQWKMQDPCSPCRRVQEARLLVRRLPSGRQRWQATGNEHPAWQAKPNGTNKFWKGNLAEKYAFTNQF